MWPWPFTAKQTPLRQLTRPMAREEFLRRGRIAVLDDDIPEMLEDLRRHGLAVDHLQSTDDPSFQRLASCFYDVLLLDYGGIGTRFGGDEGLDVLRYIKRVNPALRVIAFTARTFDSSKADFFRLCDGVIAKDSGVRDVLEKLELQLSETLTPAHYWQSLCAALSIPPDSQEAAVLEKRLQRAISKPSALEAPAAALGPLAKSGAGVVTEAIVSKLVELGIQSLAG